MTPTPAAGDIWEWKSNTFKIFLLQEKKRLSDRIVIFSSIILDNGSYTDVEFDSSYNFWRKVA